MKLESNQTITRRFTKRIDAWHGLNRTDGARDGELADCRNLSADCYPAIRTRFPRSVLPGYDGKTVTDIFDANGALAVVADEELYLDGELIGDVNAERKQFALVNTRLVIWPDKLVLDLNNKRLTKIEARVEGSAMISADGDMTMIPGGAVTTGTMNEERIIGSNDSVREILLYDDLVWDPDQETFSWSKRNHHVVAGGLSVGSRFIARKRNGVWGPNISTWSYADHDLFTQDDPTKGFFGIVTKCEAYMGWDVNYEAEVAWAIVQYSIYDARNPDVSISGEFEVGDPVTVEGCTILANNQRGLIIQEAEWLKLKFTAGALVSSAYYYNVETMLSPGLYDTMYLTQNVNGDDIQIILCKLKITRTLRQGEQIFMVGGTEQRSDNPHDNWSLDRDGSWYVYDPRTKVAEKIESEIHEAGPLEERVLTMQRITSGQENENVVIRRECPNLVYICERENRLWGVSNEESEEVWNPTTRQYDTVRSRQIIASGLGQPKRFYDYQGASTDSYAVAVAGTGDFTGICSYNGALLAWKEDRLYRITGSYPAEFYMRDYLVDGVAEGSFRSFATLNETLYYLAPAGVMAYAGGTPQLIGSPLGLRRLRGGIAGRDRTNYFLSAEDEGIRRTFVLDAVHNLWTLHEEETIEDLRRMGDHCLAVIDGQILRLEDESAEETISWSLETASTDEDTMKEKRYLHVLLEAQTDAGAAPRLFYRDERDETWQSAKLAERPAGDRGVWRYSLDTRRCRRLLLRLEGEGEMRLFALEREMEYGSDRAGGKIG